MLRADFNCFISFKYLSVTLSVDYGTDYLAQELN